MINSIIPGYNIYVPLYKRTSFKMPFKGDTADFSLHQKKLNFKEKTDAIKKLTNNEYVGKLGQEKINHIVENITPAAYKYLDRLLYLSKGTDTEKIMYYIKNNNLSEQEIEQKLNTISGLNRKILQYKDEYFKKFSDFSYDIESTSGGQLFISDVLNKNSNIKSIDKSLELVIKTIEHSFKKIELKYTNDLERVINKRFLSLDVISNIAPILTAARCLSNDVFNELWFNNRADLDHYFYPKLNAFEEKDYEIMYNTCYNCYQLNNNNIETATNN